MSLGTRFFTWFNGSLVGTDGTGNRYYRERKHRSGRRERRWVMYQHASEPTTVPTGWHGWLHHVTDEPPAAGDAPVRDWQKDRLANPTGSSDAYGPPGHLLRGGRRDHATGDYQPWRPS